MSDRFLEPRRQEAIGILFNFVDTAQKSVRALLGIIAAYAFSEKLRDYIGISLLVLGIWIAVYAVLKYLRFTYQVDGENLILKKGIFDRERVVIPFDRIQTVHAYQDVVLQIIGLTALKIDTAGSKGTELNISAIKKSDATALQALLKEQIADNKPEETQLESQSSGAIQTEQANESPKTEASIPLVKLSFGTLLLVGITENHLKTGTYIFAVFFGYYTQFDEIIQPYLDQMGPDVSLDDLKNLGLVVLGIFALGFVVVSVIVSLVRVILRFFNFDARIHSGAFEIKMGLLKRNEYSIPLKKIQIIEWRNNFMRRIPGIETVRLFEGRSIERNAAQSGMEIPACKPKQTEAIMEALFSEERRAGLFNTYKPHITYMTVRLTIQSVLVLLLGSAVYFSDLSSSYLILVGLLLGFVFISARKSYLRAKISTNGELLMVDKGWLFSKRWIVKPTKIQGVSIDQNLIQKYRGTAHLKIYTAGGTRTLKFLDEKLALNLRDFLLYKVETFEGSWM